MANGGPVLLGQGNAATATTSVTTTQAGTAGIEGINTDPKGGYGVYGESIRGAGVYGTTPTEGQSGVQGVDASNGAGFGVRGSSTYGTGVLATSNHIGLHAEGFLGVYTENVETAGFAVFAVDEGPHIGWGVFGVSFEGVGVAGASNADGMPCVAGNDQSVNGNYALYGQSVNGWALYADGDAEVTGYLAKAGGGFKIDHPLDPAGKYLYHSFVESPDMKNVYDGTAVLDDEGRATVELPEWFEALNRDYRYQLTAIGTPAPEVHVSAKLRDGRFSIAGGTAGQEVCWQVTGIRQDVWANAHRIPLEVEKPAEDKGRYLHSDLFPGGEPTTALAKVRSHRPNIEDLRPAKHANEGPLDAPARTAH